MAILDNIRNVMNKVIRIVCILLFAFMVIIGTYQILVRYSFRRASDIFIYMDVLVCSCLCVW